MCNPYNTYMAAGDTMSKPFLKVDFRSKYIFLTYSSELNSHTAFIKQWPTGIYRQLNSII